MKSDTPSASSGVQKPANRVSNMPAAPVGKPIAAKASAPPEKMSSAPVAQDYLDARAAAQRNKQKVFEDMGYHMPMGKGNHTIMIDLRFA